MSKAKVSLKRFILRKYVMAPNISEALKLDKKTPVDDCWVDDKYQEQVSDRLPLIGFNVDLDDND